MKSIFFLIPTFILFSIIYWTIKNGISPMPSSFKAKKTIQSLLPAIDGPIYELGSGWGHLLFMLSKHYSNLPVIGIENSWIPYKVSLFLLTLMQRKNCTLQKENFFETPLEDAALIVCYLYPKAMVNLRKKFEKELKSGTYVLCNTFAIPQWKAEKEIVLDDLYHTKIYLYRVHK